MTHAAFLSGKFKKFICNDLDFRGVELFKQAVSGKFKNENRSFPREFVIDTFCKETLVVFLLGFVELFHRSSLVF